MLPVQETPGFEARAYLTVVLVDPVMNASLLGFVLRNGVVVGTHAGLTPDN